MKNTKSPKKLSHGDEIRVISPARSLGLVSSSVRAIALQRLEKMGLIVSFSKHCEERDTFDSSSIDSRLEDIHEAFSDPNIKAILTTIGGYNSIHLLKRLDYTLIKNNPKILCGYSDITTLQNAIFTKTGLITYSGPHFSTFGCLQGIDYMLDCFKRCLFEKGSITLIPSPSWSDDEWFLDQQKRSFVPNTGYKTIHPGQASGIIIGGNIASFSALQGTEYCPSFRDAVLFLEGNYPMTADLFDRYLHSLVLQKDFHQVRGIVLGRFQIKSKITSDIVNSIVSSKEEFQKIPVVMGADFGHTLPMFVFPIGGEVELISTASTTSLTLTKT
jgi:muramoyltetrapeptide carboxypeptidase